MMRHFREKEFVPTRNNILIAYSYTLILFALILVGKNISNELSSYSLLFYASLITIGIAFQMEVRYKLVKAQLITIVTLIIVFYLQSYQAVESSKVGVIRYFFYLSLFLLIPLYTSTYKTVLIYSVFVVAKLARSLAIHWGYIDIPISNWSGLDYTHTYTLLALFCLFLFSTMQIEFKRLLENLSSKRKEQTDNLRELKKLEAELNHNYEKERYIFDKHYKKIEENIYLAESGLNKNLSIKEWSHICDEIDKEIRAVNKLIEKSE